MATSENGSSSKETKQHRKPCGTCPFTDKCQPGETGGSPVEVYVGQTFGPFWVPCHECVDYDNPEWKQAYSTPQCVGHAIMRNKIGVDTIMPEQLLRVDTFEGDHVFDSLAAFWAYHEQISLEEAEKILTPANIEAMIISEFGRAGMKGIDPKRIPIPGKKSSE